MIVAWVLAVLLFSLSWLTDRERSLEAARSAWSLFRGILPMFVIVMVLTSLSFGLISEEVLLELLIGEDFRITGSAGRKS
ncbi:MAG TPA: hypothetical protein PLS21_03880 [Synergistales bacterium]|jgi:uncharacterized membrane protein YadS|nr:hypothetical protein [Synergistales bacterium]HQO83116.1 hypothetical protein [Synergistales bacterium]